MSVRTSVDGRPRRGTGARSRRGEGSFEQRRDALAASALLTLGELGYARASLREIAANSPFTHGVVHYYFRDKAELITHCVRHYKATCVHRYDDVLADAATETDLLAGFAGKMVSTIVDDAAMHRLWYDLRTQSMFEPSLREGVLDIDAQLVRMIDRVLSRYAELSGRAMLVPVPTAYAMLDGVFERALMRHLAGEDGVLEEIRGTVLELLPSLFAPVEAGDETGRDEMSHDDHARDETDHGDPGRVTQVRTPIAAPAGSPLV